MSAGHTIGQVIGFDDVQVGDLVTFSTRDNGFGGTGALLDRTGPVIAKTAKTATVGEVAPLRYPTWPAEPTYTARLRAADWYDRSVRYAGKAKGKN